MEDRVGCADGSRGCEANMQTENAVTRGNRSQDGPRRKGRAKKKREPAVARRKFIRDSSLEMTKLGYYPGRYVRVREVVRLSFLTAVWRIRHLGEMEMKGSTVDCSIAQNGDRHGRRSNEECAPSRTLFCRGRLRGETISSGWARGACAEAQMYSVG